MIIESIAPGPATAAVSYVQNAWHGRGSVSSTGRVAGLAAKLPPVLSSEAVPSLDPLSMALLTITSSSVWAWVESALLSDVIAFFLHDVKVLNPIAIMAIKAIDVIF